MAEYPNMTATEVAEAEKAFLAEMRAERANRAEQPDPLAPLINRILELCKDADHD